MELYTFQWIFSMPQAHYFPSIEGRCSDDKTLRQALFFHNKRMISHYFELLRQSNKYSFAIMLNGACFAVHGFLRPYHFPTEIMRHPLHPEAHSQDRNSFAKFDYDIGANAKICLIGRIARTGRNNDLVVISFFNFL